MPENNSAAIPGKNGGAQDNSSITSTTYDNIGVTQNASAPSAALMTRAQAAGCIREIRAHQNKARVLLLELHDREGWRALGYKSWRQCALAEFAQAQSHLYRELQAAMLEREISPNGGNLGLISERVLRPLVALKSADERRAAWQEAKEIAAGKTYKGKAAQFHKPGKITAAIVQAVVDRRLSDTARTDNRHKQKDIVEFPVRAEDAGRIVTLTRRWNDSHPEDTLSPTGYLSRLLSAIEQGAFPPLGKRRTGDYRSICRIYLYYPAIKQQGLSLSAIYRVTMKLTLTMKPIRLRTN